VQPHDNRRCHPFRYVAISGHQARPKAGDHARSFSLYRTLVAREEDDFIVAHVNRMGNKWTPISRLFGGQFGARDSLTVKHRANWLIRDVENAFLHHRLTLRLIEEILSIETGLGRRGGSESPFDPQQFFAERLFELSIERI
jgi:hypothetical protein